MIEAVRSRRGGIAVHLALAATAYVPLLRTAPGVLNADTKSYLYLDPGRFLARASSLWDPAVGTGTVSHQIIGYLWPMGPFFWLAEALGLPDWVAQRLWLGTILFAAGAGMLFLFRTLGLRGAGPFAGAAVYMLTPYILAFASRTSVLLLPWAGLPWLIGMVERALRQGGWRYPALFALVVTTVGSINASSLGYAGLAVVAWVPFAIWGAREVSPRAAFGTVARIGGLTAACQLWWLSALVVGGRYGIPVLEATETVQAVASSSTATEISRGLGNWFFYGYDNAGPWVGASVRYTQEPWLIATTFAIPVMALVAAACMRWRLRPYFALLGFGGVVIAVGAFPYEHPSPLGSLLRDLAHSSQVGLALRNTPRAVPLVVLANAALLCAGISALARRHRRLGAAAAALLVGIAAVNLPALWAGDLVDPGTSFPQHVPDYWQEAAHRLDSRSDGTRVLELPGSDFSAYRWGNTIDPVTPGLISRPWVAPEALPLGSVPSWNLLHALDRRLQEGILDPPSVAPVARLLGAGDVLFRLDLQHERYRTPRPRTLWQLLSAGIPGLGSPEPFGTPSPNMPDPPLLDEATLAVPTGAPEAPPVAVLPVEQARAVVRAAPVTHPVVLAGDGEGVVDAAAAGLLEGGGVVRYSGSLDERQMRAALDDGAALVVTDTNRRAAHRFMSVRNNAGYTERADERPLEDDESDARFDLFPGAGPEVQTVAEQRGVRGVQASHYGNVVTYTPENRAAHALDGDPWTAWRVGDFAEVVGERLVVELEREVTSERLVVLQPIWRDRSRRITRATLRFDTGPDVSIELGEQSRSLPGQAVGFPARTFSKIELVIDATSVGRRARYDGVSPVGIAELLIEPAGHPGAALRVDELLRLPTDLLDKAGPKSREHPLTLVMTRARSNPAEAFRDDEEPALARLFHLPWGRSFSLRGTARLSAVADDAAIDRFLGVPDGAHGGMTSRSSGRLPGDVAARAWAAVDGDQATFWSPGLLEQRGHWLEFHLPRRTAIDRLDLVVVADGRHSVPTRLRIEGDLGEVRVVDVPPVVDAARENATAAAPMRFPPLTTARVRITVEDVREVRATDYYGGAANMLPVGIAEVGLPRLVAPTPDPTIPPICHEDLLTVDGRPVGVRLVGSRTAAEQRGAIDFEACDAGRSTRADTLDLGSGEHVLRTVPGRGAGIDIDRVLLESATPAGVPAATTAATPPRITVGKDRRHALDLRVSGAQGPFWLVLGQSLNSGWDARIGGRTLGKPVLVDAMANGWRIDPERLGLGESFRVELRWRPQRLATLAMNLSLLGALLCIALAVGPARRPWGRGGGGGDTTPSERSPYGPAVLTSPVRTGGTRVGIRRTLAWSAVAIGTAGAAGGAPLGLLAGGVTCVGLLAGPSRVLRTAGALAGLGAAAAYTLANQVRYDHPPGFEWADQFERVHLVALAGFGLLAIDALVGLVRHADTEHPERLG